MTGTETQIAWLSEAKLAAHAMSPLPVWLWSADATRLLWANPAGAAIFDAPSPAAAADLQFDAKHGAAVQVARLANSLPQVGTARLERLRGFGASLGGTQICLCSRILLPDNTSGILLVATERAGGELALPERARRIVRDFDAPAALFTADGEWIEGNPQTQRRLADKRDLVALGAERLAREATLNGRAEGDVESGPVVLIKLGDESKFFLLMVMTDPARDATTAPTVAAPPMAPMAPLAPIAPPASSTHRSPLRFVWQMDADGRFIHGNDVFTRLLGPRTARLLDQPWDACASALKLDAGAEIARALAERNTWSGIVVHWPVDDADDRLAIEMAGLPVFNSERRFTGFRGFGVVRDMDKLAALDERRHMPPPRAQESGKESGNVLPFPAPAAEAPPPPDEPPRTSEPAPTLSPGEHSAFQELARELSERLKKTPGSPQADAAPQEPAAAAPPPPLAEPPRTAGRDAQESRAILERLPVGILVYRLNHLLYANRAFLEWAGHPTLEDLREAGGLDSLFIETEDTAAGEAAGSGAKTLTISTVNGPQQPVQGKLFSVTWNHENALVLMTGMLAAAGARAATVDDAAMPALARENNELKAILDTATDGVLVLDRAGRVLSANRSAQALFGYEADAIAELSLGDLLAPESRRPVLDHLERLARNGGPESFDAGREAIGRVRQGGLVPLYITVGRIEHGDKLCAVLRDLTAWKRGEEELINARREAEKASTAKSEFLAKISHEIRTPLNAIIGFSEVMMEERFGPIGNERYAQYLKDIHASGSHLIALINDLLDLSKIEAGKLELSFVTVNLNDLVQQCVAILQQEANRQRVIIRTSLPISLPPIVADARSVRQIALNLLSNSIKFTGAGGQVIVSTVMTDDHEVALRLRDTGPGMSEKELQTALEPFRQIATSARRDGGGTGLGLPITKALAEANHARFRITSRRDEGTLVEVAFPATRVLAQ